MGKLSEYLMNNEKIVLNLLELIEEVKPLIGDPVKTSSLENRGKIYALAAIAVDFIPQAIMEISPLGDF